MNERIGYRIGLFIFFIFVVTLFKLAELIIESSISAFGETQVFKFLLSVLMTVGTTQFFSQLYIAYKENK